jgi:hypothetical protein
MTDQPSAKQPPSVRIFGKAESAVAYAIRDFLRSGDVPFEWTELKNDEQAREVGLENLSDRRLPVCIFSDGTRMEAPIRKTSDPSRTHRSGRAIGQSFVAKPETIEDPVIWIWTRFFQLFASAEWGPRYF